MVELSNVSYGFTSTPLYEGVSFRVAKGQKVGLVGPNGAGKSTLLSIILKKTEPLSGKVKIEGNISYVPQEIKNEKTIDEAASVKAFVDPNGEFEDHELLRLFTSLELTVKLSVSPKKLSGGQKTKLALARAFLSKPDVLLLDEPTNFMDTEGKKWVMSFLSRYEGSVIVISHDLELMDSSLDKILAINPATKSIEEYKGNYSDYVKLKAQREEFLRKERLVQEKHIARMEKGLAKMARASRFSKSKIRQTRRIEKAKDQLPDAPPEIRNIKVKVPDAATVGELPIRAINISKSYGDLTVLKDISLTVHRGERIALIGPNGVGKSTFIKILMGLTSPDSGEVIKDDMLSVGYYSQEFETFDLTQSVIDVFCEQTKKQEWFARAYLGSYMLSGDKIFQTIQTLSGGEKTRLAIAILTAKSTNLLILDEPTTYLDVLSQRIILESIKNYNGALIVVSHTPEFLMELNLDRACLFPEEKIAFWDNSLALRATDL